MAMWSSVEQTKVPMHGTLRDIPVFISMIIDSVDLHAVVALQSLGNSQLYRTFHIWQSNPFVHG